MLLLAYVIASVLFFVLNSVVIGGARAAVFFVSYKLFGLFPFNYFKNGISALFGAIVGTCVSIYPFTWLDKEYSIGIIVMLFWVIGIVSTLSTPKEHRPDAERIGLTAGLAVAYFLY